MTGVWNKVIISIIVVYTIAAITVSVNRYYQYQTAYYDFGIIDAAIWKVSRFQPPIVDHHELGNANVWIFAEHFSPSVFLLSPLYWLTDRREILLIAQSLLVGLGAFTGFLIAKKILKSRLAITALIVAFLGYVGLQNALISEFHDTTLCVFPLMLVFWAIYEKKWKTFFISLLILLGLKESFAGLGVGIGLYLLLRKECHFKVAITTIIISVIWGYLALNILIPYFSNGVYLYANSKFPETPMAVITNLFFPELKWKTIWYSFLTFGFLPLFNIALLPSIFENFLERFILSDFSSRWDLGLHYNAPLSPLMFMSSLEVLVWIQNKKIFNKIIVPLSIFLIFTSLILHRFILRGPLGLFYNPAFYKQSSGVEYMDKFLEKIPQEGIIYTQNDIAGRLSHLNVKTFRPDYRVINPDTVVLNLTPGQNPNAFSPLREDSVTKLKEELLEDPNYKLDKYGAELYIFRKISKN